MNTGIRLVEVVSIPGQEHEVLGSGDIAIKNAGTVAEANAASPMRTTVQPADIHSFIKQLPGFALYFCPAGSEKAGTAAGQSGHFQAQPQAGRHDHPGPVIQPRAARGRHSRAVAHPAAQIAPGTLIRPTTYIGNCTIGSGRDVQMAQYAGHLN